MSAKDEFLIAATARLTALIADQERLLKVIRNKKTELVRVDMSPATKPLSLPSFT
jgi:hypothetical protein